MCRKISVHKWLWFNYTKVLQLRYTKGRNKQTHTTMSKICANCAHDISDYDSRIPVELCDECAKADRIANEPAEELRYL